jgi:hypothetical protein
LEDDPPPQAVSIPAPANAIASSTIHSLRRFSSQSNHALRYLPAAY